MPDIPTTTQTNPIADAGAGAVANAASGATAAAAPAAPAAKPV
ncbi:MAG: hypothetical protein JWR63_3611, partial [Conexibacter sp.]|nr:hypothetical protein [Conexibacter sp.]